MNNRVIQSGQIVSVNIATERGTSKKPVDKILLDENGIQGDSHRGTWHRQVSILPVESIERFSAECESIYNPGDFAENITTRGINFHNVKQLDRLVIDGVQLEVTQVGKKCHGNGCSIYQEVGKCVMPKDGIFCRVIQGGTIVSGSPVLFEPRTIKIHIITMSDRASQGDYEDQSGANIRQSLTVFFQEKNWNAHIVSSIQPDCRDLLQKKLQECVDHKIDMVFTTGGTGIGPRDITPDVVLEMADKVIPGIMDHIRMKYSDANPNVILSRSVAAIINKTMVFALPGSVKAVHEYMAEILRMLEHILFMMHGLDVH